MMKRLVFLLILFFISVLPACREQSKEEIYQQGLEFAEAGKHQAATSLFKEALEKDPNYIDARLQLGIAYLETNKLDQAENELEKVQRQNPGNANVDLRLAQIYLATKRPDQAIRQLEGFSTSNPEYAEALFLLAQGHGSLNDLTKAEELLRESLRLRPGQADAQLGLAQLLYATGRVAEGRQLVDQVIGSDPENSRAYYLLAKRSIQEGDREGAIQFLENIRAIDSDDVLAAYLLGMLYLDAGEIDSARRIATALMNSKPNHPAGYRVEGVTLYQTGDFEGAIENLQKSLLGMPDQAGFYFLGLANYRSGQFEQALSSFQKALDKSPDHAKTRLMVAQTFLKQGRIEDCIRQAGVVITNDPSNANAHNILGSAYLMQDKYDLAMEHIETAIELDPELAQAHLKKGLFNLAAGKHDQGEIDLANAVSAAPEVLNARLLLASYYLRMNNFPKVLEVLEEGLAISADSAVIYNFMAAAQFGQNQPEAAVKSLQKAKSLKPEFFTPYLNLAGYHISRKDYQSALLEYQAVLEVNPSHLQVLLRSAALHEFLGQDEQAAQFYQRAAQNGQSQGYLALAAFQRRNGQLDLALKTLESGYQALPDQAEMAAAYGNQLRAAGQFDAAIAVYIHLEELRPGLGKPLLLAAHLQKGDVAAATEIAERAITESPAAVQGYLLQSAIHEYRSEWTLAEKVLQEGIAATDSDAALKMKLAQIYAKRGTYDEALKVFDSILLENPDMPSALFAKASILDVSGNKKQAQILYERLLTLDENHVPALNNLAYLLLEVYADNQRALELASKGFRLKPNDPRIIDTLGYALLKNDQAEKSIIFLEKAASLLPDEAEIRLHLARAYQAVGRKGDALASLTAIQAMNAQESQLLEAEKILRTLN